MPLHLRRTAARSRPGSCPQCRHTCRQSKASRPTITCLISTTSLCREVATVRLPCRARSCPVVADAENHHSKDKLSHVDVSDLDLQRWRPPVQLTCRRTLATSWPAHRPDR